MAAPASLLENPLGDDDQAQAMSQLDVELGFLFDGVRIPADIQAKIVSLGYSDMQVFAKIEDSAERVREVIRTDIGLLAATSPAHRAMTARVIAAWEAANKRTSRRQAEEAEQRVGDLPRTLPKAQHLELQRAFEKVHFELQERETPAPAYVEWRLEQIEDGELQAEAMTVIVSKAESSDSTWANCQVQPDGTLKLKKGKVESTPPRKPEELRAKLRVQAVLWEYLRLKFPGKVWLHDTSFALWERYTSWLLGDDVYENVVKDSHGAVQHRPTWHTLLEYEFQVRRRMCHSINTGGLSIATALTDAMAHRPTFQKYFLSPTAFAAGAAGAASSASSKRQRTEDRPHEGFQASPWQPPPAAGRGRSSGKGASGGRSRGKGRAKGGGWRAGQQNTSPDGRLKCFRYQRGTCTGSCGKVHACLACGGPHPQSQCTRRPTNAQKGGDAAGRAAAASGGT